MGNWRTVTMMGTCPAEELDALRDAIAAPDWRDPDDPREWHCLTESNGLAALGSWPATTIARGGNLSERDFDVEDVRETLEKLAKAAPGLELKVHCGDDWEVTNCIATVTLKDGVATIGDPEVAEVTGPTEEEVMGRFHSQLAQSRQKMK